MRITATPRAGFAVAAPHESPKDPARIPWQIKDAVELWARENRGTHGTIAWNYAMRCPVIEFDLRPDDPRMKEYRAGRLRHEPKECIPLHRQQLDIDPATGRVRHAGAYVAIDLEQLGVSGLLEMLNKANTWSGTGEFRNMREALAHATSHNNRLDAAIKRAAQQNARDFAKDARRHVFDVPFVNVPEQIEASHVPDGQ